MKKTRRTVIIEEAAHLFKEKGYTAATMRDLAKRMDMEAASLYNHIKSKEDILEEICTQIAKTYIAQLADIESTIGTNSQKIEALIRLHVRMIIDNKEAVSVSNNEWKHLKEPALTHFKEARSAYEKRFAAIIEDGIKKDEFHNLNVSVALFTILSAVRWVELWYKPNRDITPLELEDTLVSMLLNGLKK